MHASMPCGNVSLEGNTDADTWQNDSKLIKHRHRKRAKENGESQAAAYTRNDHHHSKVQLKECKEKQSWQLRFKNAAFHTNKQSLQAKSANSNVAGCLHSFFFPFGHINTVKRLLERHYNIRNDYKLYRNKGRNSASGCSPGVIGLLVENVIPRDEVNSERKSDQEERGEFEAGYHRRVRFTVRILLACELVE